MGLAKDRKDISNFDLLVLLAIKTMSSFDPDELSQSERDAIGGIVLSIGFLLDELPENLSDPIIINFQDYYNKGMDYLRFYEWAKSQINGNLN